VQEQHNESADAAVSRRRMLRGASVVVAGAAGVVVAGAVAATPADAAAGSPVVQGQANDAGTAATSLTASNTSSATLELNNSSLTGSNPARAGAALRLTPAGNLLSNTAPPGSMGMTTDGTVWIVPGLVSGQPYREFLYSSGNANLLAPITPTRALDTRAVDGRTHIASPNVLDGSGRLIAGQTLVLDLSPYTFNSYAIFANLTAVTPAADGYLTLFPTGVTRPNASNVNYTPSLFALSNFAVSGTGAFSVNSSIVDAVSIYASQTTHVILDLVALSVPQWANVTPSLIPGAALTGGATSLQAGAGRPSSDTPNWAATAS